jgi:hypothetical protein
MQVTCQTFVEQAGKSLEMPQTAQGQCVVDQLSRKTAPHAAAASHVARVILTARIAARRDLDDWARLTDVTHSSECSKEYSSK